MFPDPPAEDPFADDELQLGLRAAFARPSDSVLKSLEALGGAAPRIFLRDVPAAQARLIDPKAREVGDTGHYRVDGEIARGGVGVVLKGHDVDLGRDVALKVLREEHSANPVMLARFVEEAQIGGQLQHPGIVPVYELGLRADKRPYFTMKLVKGRTLASHLAERKQPSDDRRRFLTIFEAVCQTMAYAHARGVVHRDLKPSNIMLGAFGEVQVVDWGLAKVLERGGAADDRLAARPAQEVSIISTVRSGSTGTGSMAGTVMGTPSYMPPEQALGQVERVDERTDVFALGAILCEILTGAPPYTGAGATVMQQAIDGKLDEARARLHGCGDAELAKIATSCLRSEQRTRPRNADVIAKRISGYFAGADARTRAAQLEAAEASARAHAERRARKLTLSLGGALVVALALAGGSWWWVELGRIERRAATDRTVEAALSELAVFSERGSLADCVATAKRAVDLAQAGHASPELLERASLALFEVRRVERDRAMARRLEEIRTKSAFRLGWWRTDQAYAAAFRDFGIDVEASTVDQAAALIRESAISHTLGIHLLSWITAKKDADTPDRAAIDKLDSIAGRDTEIKSYSKEEFRDDLSTTVATIDVDSADPDWIDQLARSLQTFGESESAFALYLRGVRRHPDSFRLNIGAASVCLDFTPPRLLDARVYAQAALALQPESSGVMNTLGLISKELGDFEEAERAFRWAVHREPDEPIYRSNLGDALRKSKRFDESLREHHRAVELETTAQGEAASRNMLGAALQDMGDAAAAEVEWRRAIELDRNCAEAWGNLAGVLQHRNEWDSAIEASREAIRLKPDMAPPHHWIAHAYYGVGRSDDALEEIRRWKALDPRSKDCHLEEDLLASLWLRDAMPAVIRGDSVVLSAAEKTRLSRELYKLQRVHLASKLAMEALAKEPGLPDDFKSYRTYNAACYAALVATGSGIDVEDVDDPARARSREQAIELLGRALASCESELAAGRVSASDAKKELTWWLGDSDLAALRDAPSLAALPQGERDTLEALWARVRELIEQLH